MVKFFRSFVIYRDPLVSEARRARVVLIKLKERVNEVLVELPDYPLLKQVSNIITNLYYSFSRYYLLLIKFFLLIYSVL